RTSSRPCSASCSCARGCSAPAASRPRTRDDDDDRRGPDPARAHTHRRARVGSPCVPRAARGQRTALPRRPVRERLGERLLLVGAAYALTRALEQARTRWLLLVGVLVGLGFLTKMLQALLVVPGFALVYLVAAPASLRHRAAQLVAAGVALVASAGWWVAVVALWPASSRPYIGGSQDNSILNLIFGYNGFGRITRNETGSVIGGA